MKATMTTARPAPPHPANSGAAALQKGASHLAKDLSRGTGAGSAKPPRDMKGDR